MTPTLFAILLASVSIHFGIIWHISWQQLAIYFDTDCHYFCIDRCRPAYPRHRPSLPCTVSIFRPTRDDGKGQAHLTLPYPTLVGWYFADDARRGLHPHRHLTQLLPADGALCSRHEGGRHDCGNVKHDVTVTAERGRDDRQPTGRDVQLGQKTTAGWSVGGTDGWVDGWSWGESLAGVV